MINEGEEQENESSVCRENEEGCHRRGNDEWTAQEWAKMAAEIACPRSSVKVLEASAEIAKNCRVWNTYADGSADFDVWIRFTAFAGDSFVMGGAYLSDLWAASSDNREETVRHMYIRRFKEVR